MLRLLPNGTRDNSFALPASNITYDYALALQPDGKLLVADPAAVKRFDANGALDATFTGPTVEAGNLAVQPDGKILVGGNFQRNTGSRAYTLVRLNPNGTADASFAAPSITGTVNALLLQPNNRILLGGLFTGTGLPANLARLLTTGQADASFGATALPNATVSALLVQPARLW